MKSQFGDGSSWVGGVPSWAWKTAHQRASESKVHVIGGVLLYVSVHGSITACPLV